MTRALHWTVLLPLLGLFSQDLRGQEAFDKDAFLSRKKWYVTFLLSLKGRGEGKILDGSAKWDIQRQVGGTFELDRVGMSAPRGSTLASGEKAAGRFVSWDASVGLSSIDYQITDRVEHKSVLPGEGKTNVQGYAKLVGAGSTQFGRFKQILCDLKTMTFDFVVSDLGGKRSEPRAKTLRLTGEYHDFTPANQVATDVEYDPVEAHFDGALPYPEPLGAQLLGRPLELKQGRIAFTASLPVDQLPPFPGHTGSVRIQPPFTPNRTISDGPPLTLSLDVTISPTPPSRAKLILTPPDDYSTEWRPMCSESETIPGNQFTFAWKLQEEGGDPGRPARAEKITFALLNTSREPGVCMNRPLQPALPPEFDLRFPQFNPPISGRSVSMDGQKLVLDGAPARAGKGKVSIDCFDSGATAALVAEAQLEDGRVLKGVVEPYGEPKLLIPDRDDESVRIARGWRNRFARGKQEQVDDEKFPTGDGQPGDGLTVWEEYRGFWIGGKLEVGDPATKDVFILNEIGARAQKGLDLLADMTSLRVHDKMEPGDMRADRVINFNKGTGPHMVDQHALRMVKGGFVEVENGIVYTGSRCVPVEGMETGGPPKNTDYVTILPSMLLGVLPVVQERPGETFEISAGAQAVAHELCHALGVRHHGDKDGGAQHWTYQRGSDGELTVFVDGRKVSLLNEDGTPYPILLLFRNRKPGEALDVWTGVRNGEHSGDDACLMRYHIAEAYWSAYKKDVLYYHLGAEEVWGDRLCKARAGTGVNLPAHKPQSRYFEADSGRGNCEHHFVVSDRWEKKN